jgi:protein-disulfide isomerase
VTVLVLAGPGSPLASAVKQWRDEGRKQAAVARNWDLFEKIGHRLDPFHLEAQPQGGTVIEFADYECPYCRAVDTILSSWLTSNPGVRLVYVDFPIPGHSHATDAARAAECADRQGKFREMHGQLMSSSRWLSDANWIREAVAAGVVDTVQFRLCETDSATIGRVRAATQLGQEIGVQATPTFIGKSGRQVGVVTVRDLQRLAGSEARAHVP